MDLGLRLNLSSNQQAKKIFLASVGPVKLVPHFAGANKYVINKKINFKISPSITEAEPDNE